MLTSQFGSKDLKNKNKDIELCSLIVTYKGFLVFDCDIHILQI